MDTIINKNFEETKRELIKDIEKRVESKVLESENANLLIKLINNADNSNEAIMIAQLGTSYKRTGFHYDKRLEKMTDDIKYLKKNEDFSFDQGGIHHKLIIGDNYDALQQLLICYKRKIDVIYIDPPYGKDSMGQFADMNYDNSITRDNLLSMMFSRLMLAKELLSSNGFIFCSIDDKNYAYIKCLFDEVFGEKCYINSFVWQKNSSEKTDKSQFTINTEYVLFYSSHADYILNDTYKPLSANTIAMYNRDDNDGRGKYRLYPLQKPSAPGPETTYDYIDNHGKVWPCPPKGWRINKNKMKELENDGRLVLTTGSLNEKAYWNERPSSGKRIDTLWNDLPQNTAGSSQVEELFNKLVFDNPKPYELIKRCVDIQDSNAVVLDFFAGSGTTLQAVLELNKEDGGKRQCLLVQLNEDIDINSTKETVMNQIEVLNTLGLPLTISSITAERCRRLLTGKTYDGTNDFKWIKSHGAYGGSLDVYEIATVPNFETSPGKTPFDVIDETCYGELAFNNIQDKIRWVCEHFENTQKILEKDAEYLQRVGES